MRMKHRDLFISHSASDGDTAALLAADFEKRGIACWYAPRDIPMGSTYQAEIVNAIEHCRAMLLLFSGAANKSEHILREVELAAQSNKPIYPLRIDRAQPAGGLKYMLANRHWVERKALGDRLVDTIEQLLGGKASPPPKDAATPDALPLPVRRGSQKRSAVLIGAGAAAACLILAAGWFLLPHSPSPTVERRGEPPSRVADATDARGTPSVPDESKKQPPANNPTPEAPTPAPAKQEAPAPAPAPVPAPAPPPVQETRAPADPVESRPQPPPAAPTVLTAAPADARTLGSGVHLFKECDLCPVMAVVPAGRSLVGSPAHESGRSANEGPQQAIVVGQPFAVGRSEVSFEEWLACVAEGGCNSYRPGDYGWGYGKRPAINVSWTDAKAYVEWLSRKTGATYRLLSEAEWEYAARGCTSASCASTPFWFGAEIVPTRANYDWRFSYNGSPRALPPRRTVDVDTSEPNAFGLLHVHGNVSEWVEDCWNPTLAGLPADAAARATGDCNSRVVRGGSWADEPKDVRLAKRNWEVAGERRAQIGFRVARALVRQAQGQ